MSKKLGTDLLTLCDYAMTSQQGKLSVIGLFDRIFVSQVPSKYPRFFIVAILVGEPNSEYDLTLSVLSPSEKELLPSKAVKVNLGVNGKANILTDVANLTLQEIGEYRIVIRNNDDSVGMTSFHVNKVVPPKKDNTKN